MISPLTCYIAGGVRGLNADIITVADIDVSNDLDVAGAANITGAIDANSDIDVAGIMQGSELNDHITLITVSSILDLMSTPAFLYAKCDAPVTGTLYDMTVNGHNGTYTGTWVAADRVMKKLGWVLNFNGTDTYINMGDHDDFSIGNGAADQAITFFGVIEVVDAAATQSIISKWDNTTGAESREWSVIINSTEHLYILLEDESVNILASRGSDAALSVGWHTFAITYDGSGGAAAADGIIIYVDGAVVASTATNNAAYVATENSVTPCWVGSRVGSASSPSNFFEGSIGILGLDKSEWSAAQINRIHRIFQGIYGI